MMLDYLQNSYLLKQSLPTATLTLSCVSQGAVGATLLAMGGDGGGGILGVAGLGIATGDGGGLAGHPAHESTAYTNFYHLTENNAWQGNYRPTLFMYPPITNHYTAEDYGIAVH